MKIADTNQIAFEFYNQGEKLVYRSIELNAKESK